MSEFTVPSYRVRPQRAGFQVPWRMMAVSGAVLAAAVAGGAVVWGVSRAVNRTVPTIEADERPIRVKPSDPGGLRVANQDERIFESQRRGTSATPAGPARMTPEAERPDVAALRQAARAAAPVAPEPAPPVETAPAIPPVSPPVASAAIPAAAPAAAPTVLSPSVHPEAARPALTSPTLANPTLANSATAPQAPRPAVPAPVAALPAQPTQTAAAPVPAITPPPMPANAPAAAAVRTAPLRTGRAVVQLGAVTSEEAAQGEWARLQSRIPELLGRQPQVTRVDRGDLPPLWRIRAVDLPDAAAARGLCAAAKAKGAPCAVIGG